jgi:hydrogenase maturation protease
MTEILVLGVGNTLLSDEGAGVHAMHYLQSQAPSREDIEYLDAGTLSFTLADDIASAVHLIILDAAQLNAEPGTVRVFENDELDEFLRFGRRSVHEVGFADLMDIARLQDCLPLNRALIGIQPGDLGWGERPGTAVEAAFPQVANLTAELIKKWSMQKSPQPVQDLELGWRE